MKIEDLRKAQERINKPFSCEIELTQKCNLKCKFCFVCDRSECGNKKVIEKTTSEWLELIKKASEMGVLFVTFTGGEVFLREDFEEIYCKSCEMGLKPIIYTNGVLLSEQKIKYLKKYQPMQIDISLYGMSPETYELVTGNKDAYGHVMDTIGMLKKNGIKFGIKVLAMRPLLKEYQKISEFIQMNKIPFNFITYFYPQREDRRFTNKDWRLQEKEIIEFKKFFIEQKLIKSPEKKQNFQPKAFTCGGGKTSFTITSDGKMQPCPTLSECYTLPFEQGLEAAWNELREKVQAYTCCAECESCEECAYCHNCPARRYSATGSVEKCNDDIKAMARIKHELCDYYQK